MANILLNKLSLAQIKNQLSKMQSESEAAQKRLESAINGLDFEVASKENIRTKLNKLNTQLYKQISLSEQYGNVFTTVTNSFADVDKSFGNQSQSIMDRIKNFLEDASSTISDLLTRNKILKYSAIAGLFLPGTSILSIIILKDVLENFVVWVKNIFAGNGSEKTDTNSDNDKGTNKEKGSNESGDKQETEKEPEPPAEPVNQYDQYRQKADTVNNDANVAYQGQLYRVSENSDGTYSNNTGICNVCATDTLLNRKLSADGKTGQNFTVENVLEANGCTGVEKYDGKSSRVRSNGTVRTYNGMGYKYNGSTGGCCDKSYTNSNGTTYSLSSENASAFNNNMTAGGYNSPEEYVAGILDKHPEGIMIRNKAANHVVVITDYEMVDGKVQLYVADPSNIAYQHQNRIPYEQSYMSENCTNLFSSMDYIAYIS